MPANALASVPMATARNERTAKKAVSPRQPVRRESQTTIAHAISPSVSPGTAESEFSTRERIVRAAAAAFAERGYAGVNLTEVVEELGFTKGAFYFYFDGKDALVSEIVDRSLTAEDELFKGATAANALDAVISLTRAAAIRYREDALMRAGMRLRMERDLVDAELTEPFGRWIERLTVMLRRAKRTGELRREINERRAARTIVAVLYGAEALSASLASEPPAAQLDDFWEWAAGSLRP